jgi:hypothetical protein
MPRYSKCSIYIRSPNQNTVCHNLDKIREKFLASQLQRTQSSNRISESGVNHKQNRPEMRPITYKQHKIHTASQNLGKITRKPDRNSRHHRSGTKSNDNGQFTQCHIDTMSAQRQAQTLKLQTCNEKVPRRNRLALTF